MTDITIVRVTSESNDHELSKARHIVAKAARERNGSWVKFTRTKFTIASGLSLITYFHCLCLNPALIVKVCELSKTTYMV